MGAPLLILKALLLCVVVWKCVGLCDGVHMCVELYGRVRLCVSMHQAVCTHHWSVMYATIYVCNRCAVMCASERGHMRH